MLEMLAVLSGLASTEEYWNTTHISLNIIARYSRYVTNNYVIIINLYASSITTLFAYG